jgi:DNA-binding response OmpR family regulator
MTTIAKGLVQHTVVIVVAKKERAIAMEALLNKISCRVITTLSLYDALKTISQEMPHLVIADSELADGSAANLYDRLEAHQILKKTPILVTIIKKTKEDLQAISKRKFAGFFLGIPEPKQFLVKTLELLSSKKSSPFFLDFEASHSDSKLNVSFSGRVIGRTEDQLMIRSGADVDSNASLVCVPSDIKYSPILVKSGNNMKDADGIINSFPIGKVAGKGRLWVEKMPSLKTAASSPQRRTLLYYDPSVERANQLAEVLKGYEIELNHAQTLNRAAATLKSRPESIGCIFLYELMNDGSSIEWKKVYDTTPQNTRPPIIIGTNSQNTRSTADTKYIQKPFGLGPLIETLESCFERSYDVTTEANKSGYSGIEVQYQAPGKLVCLDEVGGVFQVKFPLVAGSKVKLTHALFKSMPNEFDEVLISNIVKESETVDTWQIRFEALKVGTSKTKHWEKISKAWDDYLKANQVPEAS